MHIKYRDENCIVKYLQTFLKENYDNTLLTSGVYDEHTHDSLIGYLMLPNVETATNVRDALLEKYTFVDPEPPHEIVNGGGFANFNYDYEPSSIVFRSKLSNEAYSNAISFVNDYIQEISEFVSKMGWKISDYTNPNYNNVSRIYITFVADNRSNYFPNKELLPMVNLFNGQYIYNMAIQDSKGYAGFAGYSDVYKIAIIPCKPGDSFTISHGYDIPCEMVIATSDYSKKEIKSGNYPAYNIVNRLNSGLSGPVTAGEVIIYDVPLSDDRSPQNIIIQMPYKDDLTYSSTAKTRIYLGDVDLSGSDPDETDVALLDKYVSAISKGEEPPFKLTGANLIAANVDGNYDADENPIIDGRDLSLLRDAVSNGINLGFVYYDKPISISDTETDRLLVLYGKDYEDKTKCIPADTFYKDTWMIHEKFIQYLLRRAIHKYSNPEDIIYLQEMVMTIYPQYKPLGLGYYDDEKDYLTKYKIVNREKKNADGSIEVIRAIMKNGTIYTGYYIGKDSGNVIQESTGEPTSYAIRGGCVYKDELITKNIVSPDGYIVSEGYQYSLKEAVKRYQHSYHSDLRKDDALQFANSYTLGYLDVETEEFMTSDIYGLEMIK